MSRLGEWPVDIVSVDPVTRSARVQWNHNPETTYYEHQLTKLFGQKAKETT